MNALPDDSLDAVIASIIVQVHPRSIDDVTTALATRNGLEVHGQDPRGRLVLVLEMSSDAELADAMSMIGNVPGVLGVNLVYHHSAAFGNAPEAAFTETRDA